MKGDSKESVTVEERGNYPSSKKKSKERGKMLLWPKWFRLKWLILLLVITVGFASCAPLEKPCIECALSCDAEKLKNHQEVHVVVQYQSKKVVNENRPVSSLLKGTHCSVVWTNCSNSDKLFTLNIYPADDDDRVTQPIYKNGSKPDCVSEDISDTRSGTSDADRNRSNRLLVLLPVCLCIFLYFKGSRCIGSRHGSNSCAKYQV